MTDQQRKEYLERVRKFTDELIAKGPDACREFLVKLGVCHEDGGLTENYGGEALECHDEFCAWYKDTRCRKSKTKYDACKHKRVVACNEEFKCYNMKCKWHTLGNDPICLNDKAKALNNCTGRIKRDPSTSPCFSCPVNSCLGVAVDQISCGEYRKWRYN